MSKKIKNLSRENIEENEFWSEGSFIESINSNDLKNKMKTFHKRHDEDMNFKCKKCNKQISAHNKDWHDGMCNDCFNAVHFPNEEQKVIEER